MSWFTLFLIAMAMIVVIAGMAFLFDWLIEEHFIFGFVLGFLIFAGLLATVMYACSM